MKQLLTLALFSVLFVGCKKESKESNSAGVDFTTIRKFDIEANFLGTEGDASDDYTHEEWPQWVYDAFKPMDTTSLVGYEQSQVSIDALYPNPFSYTQTMRLFATQPANLKVIIMDVHKNVLFARSMHAFTGIQFKEFDYSDLNLQPNTFYRMFYGFSAEGKPFFLRGHIDIYKQL